MLRAAKELGYRPNVHAKGLATKRTECIGVAIDARHIPLESTSFYGPVLEAIEVTLAAEGYHTVFTVLRQHQPPRCALEGRVDGLVFLGTDIGENIVTPVKEIPVVLVDNHLPGFDGVVGDNLGGARLAVEHLIEHGHKRIAFVTETLRDLSFRERLEGYRQALSANGVPFDERLVIEGERGPDDVKVAMRNFFSLSPLPTAIFAANDHMAVGAIYALKERGYRVPEDVAVVGFDDGDLAPHIDPPLTSVFVPRREMGKVAARRLLELIRGEEPWARVIVLATELVRRRS